MATPIEVFMTQMTAPMLLDNSQFIRARVFKWNQTLPEDSPSPDEGVLMLMIKNESVSVSKTTPIVKDVTYSIIPETVIFNLQDLLSLDNIENMVRDVLDDTYQFHYDDVAYLTAKISKYLVSNFDFSVETLSCTNATKIVIVVDLYKKMVFASDKVKGVVKGDKNRVYGNDDIVFSLRNCLNLPFFYNNKPIVEVPALRIFQLCDGGVSEEDTCPICLEELLVNQNGIRKTSCSHVFHGGCLARWLWTKQSCPMCRFQLS